MTQEEKDLLLKDLSARLSYGLQIHITSDECDDGFQSGEFDNTLRYHHLEAFVCDRIEIKPYLRPMSSMTEEEREEIEVFIFNEWYQEDSCKIDKEGWIEILANYDVSGIDPCFCSDYVDWLNEHHFDYRNLIEKGLAFEAPEDMYKTE